MLLLSLPLAIQPSEAVSPPLEAYGAESGWHVRIGRNGVILRWDELSSGPTWHYLPRTHVTRDGAKTVFSTRTAGGQPVVLTIEPGECGTSDNNQTALQAQLSFEGRRLSGCAEDGIDDTVPTTPMLIGDYLLDYGVRAIGRNGEWSFGAGGLAASYLLLGGTYLDGETRTLQSRVEGRAATFRFSTDRQAAVAATVRIAPCTLADGSTYPFTVEVQTGGSTLLGCGWQGNSPTVPRLVSDGGSDPVHRSGEIHNDLDYPASAVRAAASGAVLVRYVVGADGRVASCEVTESAGNADLDLATCRLLQARYRFEPARDRSGQPREAIRYFRMVWRLPHS